MGFQAERWRGADERDVFRMLREAAEEPVPLPALVHSLDFGLLWASDLGGIRGVAEG